MDAAVENPASVGEDTAELAVDISLDYAIAVMWAYGVAWVKKDADAITRLFSKEAAYVERPDAGWSYVGLRAIRRYWQKSVAKQFAHRYQLVDDPGGLLWDPLARCAILKFRAQFTSGVQGFVMQNEWLATIRFDAKGKICRFEEYWHKIGHWDETYWKSAAERLKTGSDAIDSLSFPRVLRGCLSSVQRDTAAVICGCGSPHSWTKVLIGEQVPSPPLCGHAPAPRGQKQAKPAQQTNISEVDAYNYLLAEVCRRGGCAPVRLLFDSNPTMRRALAPHWENIGVLQFLRNCPHDWFDIREQHKGRRDWQVSAVSSTKPIGSVPLTVNLDDSVEGQHVDTVNEKAFDIVAASASEVSKTAAAELVSAVCSRLAAGQEVARSIVYLLKDRTINRRLHRVEVVDPRWHACIVDTLSPARDISADPKIQWESRLRLLARVLCEHCASDDCKHELSIHPCFNSRELSMATVDSLCSIKVACRGTVDEPSEGLDLAT